MEPPVTVPLTAPLDLDVTLDSAQAFRWGREVLQGGWREGIVEGFRVGVRATEGRLEIRGHPDPAGFGRRYFRLDDDYGRIVADLRDRFAPLRPALDLFPGLRLLRTAPWECLASFIVSQNNNVRRIEGIVARLAARYGAPIAGGQPPSGRRGLGWHAFPDAKALADASLPDLKALGLGYRAAYLRDAARHVLDHGLRLEDLRREDYATVHATLLEIPGVGPKVADCVAVLGLDQMEAFPVDVHVARAYVRLFHRGRRMPVARVARLARQRFGTDAGYAQQFIFHLGRRGRGT